MAENHMRSAENKKQISIIVAPMTLAELEVFKFDVEVMGKNVSALFMFEHEELEVNNERSARIIVEDCSNVEIVAIKLSQRREILWIEGSHEIQVSNKWGKGICQSGDYSETPMYSADLTGEITKIPFIHLGLDDEFYAESYCLPFTNPGDRQIVGVADTGVDMQSCYFIDPNVPVPYNKVSSAHRKVVTYITGQDMVDDSTNGHGTHVCGSLVGKCNKDWSDYKAFNGVAYNAKIAFYDIGLAGSYTLNPPSNLESGLFGERSIRYLI